MSGFDGHLFGEDLLMDYLKELDRRDREIELDGREGR